MHEDKMVFVRDGKVYVACYLNGVKVWFLTVTNRQQELIE